MHYAFAFILLAALCTVFAFKRHPIYALYFYLASIFVYPPSRWWGYMLPDLRWSLLSAAIATLSVLFHRGKLNPKPPVMMNAPAILLCMYAAWMWIQTPWALDQSQHIEGSVQYVKYLIAFWFIYRMIDSKARVADLLLGLTAGCALLGVYAQFSDRSGGRLDGVGGPGMDDSNTLAMYLATGLISCMGLVLSQRGWRRWLSAATLPVILNGFVLANSRGSFLGVAAGVLVLALCKAKAHRRLFWALMLVAAVGVTFVVDSAFMDRMATIGDVTDQDNEQADASARSRLVIVEAQMRMAADYPMGVGFRGTIVLSPRYLDSRWLTKLPGTDESVGRSSHNTFMTTLVEQGIPGALMFLALVTWIVVSIFKLRRPSRYGADPELATMGAALCGGLVVVIVAGTATDYFMAEVQFWLYAGLVSTFQLAQKKLPPAVSSVRTAASDPRGRSVAPIAPRGVRRELRSNIDRAPFL